MTENTQGTPPAPGTPEYDAAMAAKFRATKEDPAPPSNEIEAAAKSQRPENVPEKFWNAETGAVNVDALLKSYSELERMRSGKTGDKPAMPADQPAHQTPEGQEAAAQDVVKNAGLDWNTLTQKIVSDGKLGDDDYAALEKIGVPRAVVEDYVQLAQAHQQRTYQDAMAYIGGEQEATSLMQWAAKSLPEAEITRYNAMLQSADWKIAVDALKARRASTSPTAGEPSIEMGGNAAGRPSGYRSRAEMKADMAKPEYQRDPKFRQTVAERMRFATWDLDR